MLTAPDIEHLVSTAHEHERQYEWSKAAGNYQTALQFASTSGSSRQGELAERMGYAIYRWARQAESTEALDALMRRGINTYAQAKTVYNEQGPFAINIGRMVRCDAMIAHCTSWLTSEPLQKRKLFLESWGLAKEALTRFLQAQETEEFWTTLSQLSLSSILAVALEPTGKGQASILQEGLATSEEAIKGFSGRDPFELARAHATAFVYIVSLRNFFDFEEFESLEKKALLHWDKALGLSEEGALTEVSNLEWLPLDLELGGTDKALEMWKKALTHAEKTMDRLNIGHALDCLAWLTSQKGISVDSPDEGTDLLSKALKQGQDATRLYRLARMEGHSEWLYANAPEAGNYMVRAYYHATSLEHKRSLLEKGLQLCPELLKQATEFGYPGAMMTARHIYSGILGLLGKTEPASERKKAFLTQALEHRNEGLKLVDELQPFQFWNRGLNRFAAAELKALLAELANDIDEKREMLVEAVIESEKGCYLCFKHAAFFETKGVLSAFPTLGIMQYNLGDLQIRLFETTGANEHLRKAVESYRNASESYAKTGIASRMAECRWSAGRAYVRLAEHMKASEEFLLASQDYGRAAEKIPRLKSFYQDKSTYMEAWSHIELARHHHEREEYVPAKGHYETAAVLHSKTRGWSYIAANYSAWAGLEAAEGHSRTEQSDLAIDAFREAARLFEDTKATLQKQLDSIEEREEKTMVRALVKASDIRQDYCRARITLEEARVLDKAGDHQAASHKYSEAARTFEEISRTVEPKEERRKIELVKILSKAWETMARAEAQASPLLYNEASGLFEQAKDLSSNSKTIMLALGDSRFCKALEAGTRFADTRDSTFYVAANQHLESAADYYSRAGFPNPSNFAKATKLLLEGYMFVGEAVKERDQERKARLYAMAERVLEEAAALFTKAQYPARRQQVLKLLARVEDDRELAISLSELLQPPLTRSAVAQFPVPSPTYEQAVGLGRFEQADIQGSVTLDRRNPRVGEKVEIGIELINAGKGIAQLVKVDGVVPAGFEIHETPDKYPVKNDSIDVKGKRLGPLKTEEIRLVVRAMVPGVSVVSPEIRYLDESGEYRKYRIEGADVVVKEPHLPDWLRGPVPLQIPQEFRFETERTREVFEVLAKSFWDDYVVQGLFVDKAGWRSLMQLVRDTRLPRSAFYGSGRRKGPVWTELERLKLVEVRQFPEERGRGGTVTKIRLAYEAVILRAGP